MSQISNWGAQYNTNINSNNDQKNKDQPQEQKHEEKDPSAVKANVMATKENAIELSDDLVAQAHQEFEATEDKLRQFEEQEQQLQAQQ